MQRDRTIHVENHPTVYAPHEDSFLLLGAVEPRPGERFLELGTATGFVALHAAKIAQVVATDANPEAVRLARRNAIANRLSLAVVRCDLFRGLRGTFDVIAINPPYLVEGIGDDWPARAWQGGESGDTVLLRFLTEAPDYLAPDGRIYMVVPSARERALAVANGRFHLRIVAERLLFFEKLLVVELRDPR